MSSVLQPCQGGGANRQNLELESNSQDPINLKEISTNESKEGGVERKREGQTRITGA